MPLPTVLTLITGIHIAVIHSLAMAFELYWRYPWLDIPMHVAGGVLLPLLWATTIDVRILTSSSFTLPRLFYVSVAILVGWEIFGVILEQGFKQNFIPDTIIDLLCGGVGVIIGYILVRSLHTTKL
jgi:hypothetical protein